MANAFDSECDRVRQDLAIAESQLRDYQARLGKPFLYESYLSQLTTLRDQLKAGLSGQNSGSKRPNRCRALLNVAERIKALRAAHTIEATPERIGKSRGSAEEPVTARIRRRMEAILVSGQVTDARCAMSGSTMHDGQSLDKYRQLTL